MLRGSGRGDGNNMQVAGVHSVAALALSHISLESCPRPLQLTALPSPQFGTFRHAVTFRAWIVTDLQDNKASHFSIFLFLVFLDQGGFSVVERVSEGIFD